MCLSSFLLIGSLLAFFVTSSRAEPADDGDDDRARADAEPVTTVNA